MEWPLCFRMDMPRESFNPTFSDLVDRLLANTGSENKLGESTYDRARYEVTLLGELIPGAKKIVHVDERSFSDLVHRLYQPHGIMGIEKSATHFFQTCGIAEQIKHYG